MRDAAALHETSIALGRGRPAARPTRGPLARSRGVRAPADRKRASPRSRFEQCRVDLERARMSGNPRKVAKVNVAKVNNASTTC
jgi:hypothetical protein